MLQDAKHLANNNANTQRHAHWLHHTTLAYPEHDPSGEPFALSKHHIHRKCLAFIWRNIIVLRKCLANIEHNIDGEPLAHLRLHHAQHLTFDSTDARHHVFYLHRPGFAVSCLEWLWRQQSIRLPCARLLSERIVHAARGRGWSPI